MEAEEQSAIDHKMIDLDGSPNKGNLGANAILAVSMAAARASAESQMTPLYRYLGGVGANLLPVPQMNILNGGAHADNSVDPQEFMVAALWRHEVRRSAAHGRGSISHAEGCFEEARLLHCRRRRGRLRAESQVERRGAGSDSGSHHKGRLQAGRANRHLHSIRRPANSTIGRRKYVFKKSDKSERTSEQMIEFWADWVRQYPIISIEDGMAENDWDGWKLITDTLGKKIQLVGDDLFVTNTEILAKGIERGIANSILIKLNQIGTADRDSGSHADGRQRELHRGRVAPLGRNRRPVHRRPRRRHNAGQIKTGSASRTDRIAKYNQLLRIEEELGAGAHFAGRKALRQ